MTNIRSTIDTNERPFEEWSASLDDIRQLEDLLEHDQLKELEAKLLPFHHSAHADMIQLLSHDEDRLTIARILFDTGAVDFWPELDEAVRGELTEQFDPSDLSRLMSQLDSDDAVAVLEDIHDKNIRETIIESLDPATQHALRSSFSWPEDSAGRLMQQNFVSMPSYYNVGDAIDWFRRQADEENTDLPEDFYDIYILDPAYKPVGCIPLSKLLCKQRSIPLQEIFKEDLPLIPADLDQEEVAFRFRQLDLISAPVVNQSGRMLGVITVDDVVDVIEEVHEADFMALGGVQEEDLYEKIPTTVSLRARWLLLNMVTASMAALVIALFEDVISSLVVLAALMPIVASLGGNAGSQTLTVAVRALATRELGPSNAWRFVHKELFVSLFNGIIIAVIAAILTFLWQGNLTLSFVIAAALIVNLITAGLFGALVPLALERFGVDPAISSSVLLTALTDIIGFFVFLAFASLFL